MLSNSSALVLNRRPVKDYWLDKVAAGNASVGPSRERVRSYLAGDEFKARWDALKAQVSRVLFWAV